MGAALWIVIPYSDSYEKKDWIRSVLVMLTLIGFVLLCLIVSLKYGKH